MTKKSKTIAVLGAGPIGIETALYAARQGFDVEVYEKDHPGAHILRWGHVEFFSPWSLNRSEWGASALRQTGVELADDAAFPTGREYVEAYLQPLVRHALLEGSVHTQTEVVGVSRRDALKGDLIGDEARAAGPFLIKLRDASGERFTTADIVIDTTGVYEQPRALGPGGLTALGEDTAEEALERWIPDPLGEDRHSYANKRTLLIGAGYSAVTSARLLSELREDAPSTQVLWLMREDTPPYRIADDDPLPQRVALSEFGNQAALGHIDGIQPVHGQLWRIRDTATGLEIELRDGSEHEQFPVDRIVSNTGYKPDVELFRELQVHQCYASEGPMNLSAYLLSQSGGGGDCLDQTAGGFDTLVSPEPDFYILGAKSYGRNSDFLLKLGYEQIETVFENLA
ncbi:MAG: NAD(P)-binding domain-containing protein [Myxococcota bacterium]